MVPTDKPPEIIDNKMIEFAPDDSSLAQESREIPEIAPVAKSVDPIQSLSTPHETAPVVIRSVQKESPAKPVAILPIALAPVATAPSSMLDPAPAPQASTEVSAPILPPISAIKPPAAPVITEFNTLDAAIPAEKQTDLTAVQEWVAHKNETLRQTLTSWTEQAGVSLVWSSEYDYPLQTDVRVNSGFSAAVRTLLAGFSKAQPRPLGRLFKNDSVGAQPVLIVETQRLAN